MILMLSHCIKSLTYKNFEFVIRLNIVYFSLLMIDEFCKVFDLKNINWNSLSHIYDVFIKPYKICFYKLQNLVSIQTFQLNKMHLKYHEGYEIFMVFWGNQILLFRKIANSNNMNSVIICLLLIIQVFFNSKMFLWF